MARLYIVRHGNTIWSGSGRYQGSSDVSLNEQGLKQASKLAQRLAPEKFAVIYSSDLKRAYSTAEAIAAPQKASVLARANLRELNFGLCEGLTFQQVSERYPEAVTIWRGADCSNPFSGGESIQQVADRISLFLPELRQWSTEDRILIVAHSGALAIMVCLMLGIGIGHWWQFKTANASLSILDTFENGAVLSLLNDLHHLDGVG